MPPERLAAYFMTRRDAGFEIAMTEPFRAWLAPDPGKAAGAD